MSEHRPLADVLRPKTLDEVVGQEHLVGDNGVIRKMLKANFLPSIVFWGPPGSGKTTLAQLLANLTDTHFVSLSAVTSKIADVRNIITEAKDRLDTSSKRTILFIDEIHRFNKAQQDAFLPFVEKGTIIFIGATTENPSFEVISPLLSRCRVLVVHSLDKKDLRKILKKAVQHVKKSVEKDAKEALIAFSNGDARTMLTIYEIASNLHASKTVPLDISNIEEAAQKKMLQYDAHGEEHYNTISAFIKSMRASDTDAALYYLARMVKAGEDPLFIARRMVIFASEDIGLAQPTALVVANAVFDGCHKVGYPEAQILLAHGTCYLARAKKDRKSYDAFFKALKDVSTYGNLPIPLKVRNAPTSLMKNLGYGKGYTKYDRKSMLPDKLKNKKYF